MGIRFIQANCVEGDRVDLRQADVVKKYKPDIIFFEMPALSGNPSSRFNNFSVKKKPYAEIRKIQKGIRRAAKKYPYALSDFWVWENIVTLWHEGHDALLYNIDAAGDLRYESFLRFHPLPLVRQKRQWRFWAYLYVREAIMAQYMGRILKKYPRKRKLTVAVFLQSIHWKHVQFQLGRPSKGKIWHYYFGKFPKLSPAMVAKALMEESPNLYKKWKKHGVW